MYQTLFYIPENFIGRFGPIQLGIGPPVHLGIGPAFYAWLLLSVALMAWLVWRQGWNDDTRSYLPILGFLGLGIVLIAPQLVEPGLGLPVRGYGVLVTLGVVCGVGLAAWQARRMGLDTDVIFTLAFCMFAAGIVGARLAYVVQYWDQFHRPHPWETFLAIINIPKGGLVVYGSVIGGLVAWLVYCRVRKLPLLAIGDLIAPGMLVGLAFGRVGCLLNGCCYGGVCEDRGLPAMRFPMYADAKARKPSDPYTHQKTLGLLHGFRLGATPSGQVEVTDVRPNSPAGLAGLTAKDIVTRIDLDPTNAISAALTVSELAGLDLDVETADGRHLAIPILPRADDEQASLESNPLGFTIDDLGPDGIFVRGVTAGGPAARAGLQSAEKLKAIHLPPLPSYTAARDILHFAESTLVLETADGTRRDCSLAVLPPHSRPVHPSQIYSTIKAALLAFFLWAYYPFRRRDGEVFALMLTIYPLFRILLEVIRDDVPGLWGTPFTFSQAMSGVILLVAVGLWFYLSKQPKGTALPLREPAAAVS